MDLCRPFRGWKLLVHFFECLSVCSLAIFGCSADLIGINMPQPDAKEITEKTLFDAVQQSVPDENPSDEIVHDLDILAEVKLPSIICKSAQIHSMQFNLNNCTE